jgi:hypothetical protein
MYDFYNDCFTVTMQTGLVTSVVATVDLILFLSSVSVLGHLHA